MDITETTLPSGTIVLALSGRLDGPASPGLEQAVNRRLTGGATRLVFDCANLVYVSSAGLRVFLAAAKQCRKAGGDAAVAALTPAVRQVFEISGFTSVFAVHPPGADLSQL